MRGGIGVLFTLVMPDPRHVSHQLAQRDGPLFPGERRDVSLNFVLEVQRAFFEKQTDGGRSERLGRVPDPEAHARGDGYALLHIRPAETFGPHEVATHTHRHRQARQVLLGKTGTREPSALVYRGGPLW